MPLLNKKNTKKNYNPVKEKDYDIFILDNILNKIIKFWKIYSNKFKKFSIFGNIYDK